MVVDLQKAGIWKRFAAWLFDFIMMITLAVGIMVLLSWILNFGSYYDAYEAKYEAYSQKYQLDQIDFDQELTQEEKDRVNAADAELVSDAEAVRLYNLLINLSLIIMTFGLLISAILLEFLLPMLLGNGQTLGKKAFSIGLIRNDSVRINNLQLFTRTVLGKFAIETMIPAYILMMILFNQMGTFGVIFMGLLAIAQLACLVLTRTNSAIHDLLAGTIVVDISSQHVFKDTEEMIAYTKRIHAEQAAREEY